MKQIHMILAGFAFADTLVAAAKELLAENSGVSADEKRQIREALLKHSQQTVQAQTDAAAAEARAQL